MATKKWEYYSVEDRFYRVANAWAIIEIWSVPNRRWQTYHGDGLRLALDAVKLHGKPSSADLAAEQL